MGGINGIIFPLQRAFSRDQSDLALVWGSISLSESQGRIQDLSPTYIFQCLFWVLETLHLGADILHNWIVFEVGVQGWGI